MKPKISTLCYAHEAPRQPYQLPDYTLMYTHIGRLAILLISTRTFIVHEKRRRRYCYFRRVAVSLKLRLRYLVYDPGIRVHTYAQPFLTSNNTWPTSLPPESTNKRIVSDDSPKIKVACERQNKKKGGRT